MLDLHTSTLIHAKGLVEHALGNIGGGYASSAEISTVPGSKYSVLKPEDQQLITSQIDKLVRANEGLQSNSIWGEATAKLNIETYVQNARETLSGSIDALREQAQSVQNGKNNEPSGYSR